MVNTNVKDIAKFNAELLTKNHIHFNESVSKYTKDYSGQLKHLITDDTITIEKKYLDRFEAPSFHNCTILTNDHIAVVKELSDRRYIHLTISDAWRVDRNDPQEINKNRVELNS